MSSFRIYFQFHIHSSLFHRSKTFSLFNKFNISVDLLNFLVIFFSTFFTTFFQFFFLNYSLIFSRCFLDFLIRKKYDQFNCYNLKIKTQVQLMIPTRCEFSLCNSICTSKRTRHLFFFLNKCVSQKRINKKTNYNCFNSLNNQNQKRAQHHNYLKKSLSHHTRF